MTSSNLMSLSEFAAEIGVPRQYVQRWHRAPAGTGPKAAEAPYSALKAVAKAMGVDVPSADDEREPRYPRSVYVAFCQAVGIMDESGALVPEIKQRYEERTRGKWLPVAPTIDPGPGRRRRLYKNHVMKLTGLAEQTIKMYMSKGYTKTKFPAPDGHDEMSRPYYFEETLASYRTLAQRQARMQPAEGAEPADNV